MTVDHEVIIEILGVENTYLIAAEFEVWQDFYGADADGNRSERVVFSNFKNLEIRDEKNNLVKDKDVIKLVQDYYDDNLLGADMADVEENYGT